MTQAGPVVVYNMTLAPRSYVARLCQSAAARPGLPGVPNACLGSLPFALAPGRLCRLDNLVYRDDTWRNNSLHFDQNTFGYVEDSTDGDVGSFNASWMTGNNNFDSCANEGEGFCAGSRWGSWMVGLMPLRTVASPDPRSVWSMAGGVEYWVENRWGSGNALYYTNHWVDTPIALIMTQGSTDGSGFDIHAANGWALPGPAQVFAAPLCSDTLLPAR
jgi:hypothetical protein